MTDRLLGGLLFLAACSGGAADRHEESSKAGASGAASGSGSSAAPSGDDGDLDAHEKRVAALLGAKDKSYEGTIDQEDLKIPFTFGSTEGLVDATTPESTANIFTVAKEEEEEERGPAVIIGIAPNETADQREAMLKELGYDVRKKESKGGGWVVSAVHAKNQKLEVTFTLDTKPKAIGCNAMASGAFAMKREKEWLAWMERTCGSLKAK